MDRAWWNGVSTGVLEAVTGPAVLRTLFAGDVLVAALCVVTAVALGPGSGEAGHVPALAPVFAWTAAALGAGALGLSAALHTKRYSPACLLSVFVMAVVAQGLAHAAAIGCECAPPECQGLQDLALWAVDGPALESRRLQGEVQLERHAEPQPESQGAPDETQQLERPNAERARGPQDETQQGTAPAELDESQPQRGSMSEDPPPRQAQDETLAQPESPDAPKSPPQDEAQQDEPQLISLAEVEADVGREKPERAPAAEDAQVAADAGLEVERQAPLSFVQVGQRHNILPPSGDTGDAADPPARATTPDAEAPVTTVHVAALPDGTVQGTVQDEPRAPDPQEDVQEDWVEVPLVRKRSSGHRAQPGLLVYLHKSLQAAHAAGGPPQAARLLCAVLRAGLLGVLTVHTVLVVLRAIALYTLVRKVSDTTLKEKRAGLLADFLSHDQRAGSPPNTPTKIKAEEENSSDTDHDLPGQDVPYQDSDADESVEGPDAPFPLQRL